MTRRLDPVALVKDERFIIAATAVIFAAAFTYLSNLRYVNFLTANWDLGIIQQMLWTGTHGYLLFETGDFVHSGARSFLQIHSTYIALLIARAYLLAPSAITLFAIQAGAVSLSIIPLYLIGRRAGLAHWVAYFCVLAYLFNFGLLSGLLYDFHWESFIPLEFLSMFYLVSRRRYLSSLIPFLIGCCTLEVFPFLGFGIVLYFAYERYSLGFLSIAKRMREREWQMIVLLFAVTVVSYVAIRAIQLELIPRILGEVAARNAVGSNIATLFKFSISGTEISRALFYWGLLYLSFLFIPFLHPKHLLLSLPWLVATLFIHPYFASAFGNQYSLVALPPLAIAFVFGIRTLVDRVSSDKADQFQYVLLGLAAAIALFAGVDANSRILLAQGAVDVGITAGVLIISIVVFLSSDFWSRRRRHLHTAVSSGRAWVERIGRHARRVPVTIILLIVIISILLSPLNPGNYKATPQPGYNFVYSSNPEFGFAMQMSSMIQRNESVLATNNLFPLVANNPSAYSLPWYPFSNTEWSYFPYNSSNLPMYIFVNSAALDTMPQFLKSDVFNQSYYGLRAFSFYNGYPGSIYLFQRHYNGTTSLFEASAARTVYYFSYSNLSIGQSGEVVRDSSSMFGYSIASSPSSNLSGNGHAIWFGPYFTFLPGRYQVIVSVKGGAYGNQSAGSVPILQMNSNSFGDGYYYSRTIDSSQLSKTNWTQFVYDMNMSEPFPNTEFRGYIAYHNNTAYGYVYLNYVEVRFIGPLNGTILNAALAGGYPLAPMKGGLQLHYAPAAAVASKADASKGIIARTYLPFILTGSHFWNGALRELVFEDG